GIGGGLGNDEKLGDVATHILFALIAQRVELGLVGVENRAVRRSPLKADGRVLEAILALHLLHPALRVVDQAEAHPGELEHHALSAAPLDPRRWGPRRPARPAAMREGRPGRHEVDRVVVVLYEWLEELRLIGAALAPRRRRLTSGAGARALHDRGPPPLLRKRA